MSIKRIAAIDKLDGIDSFRGEFLKISIFNDLFRLGLY